MNLYLNGSKSELEVSIPNNVIKEIWKKFNEGVMDNLILEKLEECLIQNMNDTFFRVLVSEEFRNWENNHKFFKETHIE